ncbi:MAG: GEVED domain-containing protein [Bacteroidetes bacterium]|nr:GEVED domain-containing protein [Bacteroidota bacterium]
MMDGLPYGTYYSTAPVVLSGLTTGDHTLILYLVDNANIPLTPVVSDTVIFSVSVTPPNVHSIYEIQYTADDSGNSPYADQEVTTGGIVTATFSLGYFIQSGSGPWSGLYVYDNIHHPLVGDSILAVGTVKEYFSMTELNLVTSMVVYSGFTPPTPSPVNCSEVNAEEWEGVLVSVAMVNCVNPSYGTGIWQIQDGSGTTLVHNLLYSYTPTLGEYYDVTGCVYFTFSEFRIEPRSEADITHHVSYIYGYNAHPVNSTIPIGPIHLSKNISGIETSIADQTGMEFIAGSSWANGVWYGNTHNETNSSLVTLDPETGTRSFIGYMGYQFTDIAYDWTTQIMYGISYDGSYTWLHSVDLNTGETTLIGYIGSILGIGLGCDQNGDLYMVDLSNDALYYIDKYSGSPEYIGDIGFDANYAQSIEFDNQTFTMYYTAYDDTYGGQFMTLDLTSGNATLVYAFDGTMEVTGLAIPNEPLSGGLTHDAGISAILSPFGEGSWGLAEPVTVTIQNYGTASLGSVLVSYSIDNNTPVVETWSGFLPAGATVNYTFSQTVALPLNNVDYSLLAWTDLPGDIDEKNDTAYALAIDTNSVYCAVEATICDEFISRVQFLTIDNVTGCSPGGYADYSGQSVIMDHGQTAIVTITNGPPVYTYDYCGIWVDWNHNADFTDEDPITVTGGISFYSADITVPDDALPGPARMRVRITYNITPSPCGTNSYGEAEDYTIVVTNPETIDVGVTAIISPVSSAALSAAEPISIMVKNFGNVPVSDIPVWYTIDGGAMVVEGIFETLQPLDSLIYTFLQPGDFSLEDHTYSLLVSTALLLDANPANDPFLLPITHPAPLSHIITSAPVLETCPGSLSVPLIIQNGDGIASLSLTLGFDSAVLSFSGFQNPNPLLSEGFLIVNATGSQALMGWYSIYPVTISEDTLLELLFTAQTGYSSLTWITQNTGACQYTDIDNLSLPAVFVDGSVTVSGCSGINGTYTYNNPVESVLSQVTVKLKQANAVVDQTITDELGNYGFNGITMGSYVLEAITDKAAGGFNSSDALLVLRHFTGLNFLTGMYLIAADVDGSGYVNAGDALLIAKRFVGLIPSFPVGDWYFPNDTVDLPFNTIVSQAAKGLCYGDVDGSYHPAVKSQPGVNLMMKGISPVNMYDRVELPLYVEENAEVGAVSLVIRVTDNSVRLLDVKSEDEGNIMFNTIGKEWRIAWYGLKTKYLQAGDVLLTLVIQPGEDEGSLFGKDFLIPEGPSELADPAGLVLPDLSLSYPCLVKENNVFSLGQNQPNPVTGQAVIPYYLAEDGQVSLRITDMLGREVITLMNEFQSAGEHRVSVPDKVLSEGVYTYFLSVNNGKTGFRDAKRMVVR